MKQITVLLALATVFIFGCNKTPNPSEPTKVNNILNPSASGGGPDAVFDIATPSFTGATQSAGSTSGHKVCLSWQSNSPDGNHTYAQDPTSPTDLNYGHGWEYWGWGQQTIVGPTDDKPNKPYSGHYELSWTGPNSTSGEVDVTADSYCIDNLPDGTYTFYLKAKSLEGDQPNAYTHHSQTTDGYQVVIQSCYEIQLADSYTYPMVGQSGGNGSWSYSTSGAATWTANSSQRNQNANVIFNVGYHHFTNTQNSCTNVITTTEVGTTSTSTFTGDIYLSIDGGTTWRKSLVGPPHQSNSNNPGGNGSGLGKFPSGAHITVIYSSTNNISGQLGTFTFIVL